MTVQKDPRTGPSQATPRPHRGRRPPRSPALAAFLSALLPGSGHLYAGRRRAGLALVLATVTLFTATALVVGLVPRDRLVGLTVRPTLLLAVMVLAVAGALVMLAVVLTAYAACRPSRLPRAGRLLSHGLVGVVCVAVVAPFAVVVSYADAQRALIGDVFAAEEEDPPSFSGLDREEAHPDPWAGQDRLNVLLIGGDGKPNREGIRNDSVTVASVDTHTGRTVLFSLPRNLEHAPFPEGSPAAEALPDGYPDFFYGVYKYGTDHPEMFPGTSDPGAAAVGAAAGETLGLTVHYYALVDINGFHRMVDALGGVRIRVEERIPIGGIGLDGQVVPASGYIEPGLQTLDGYETLWYARSRAYASDYVRMGRQRCVIGALARQADPLNVLRNFRALADATSRTLATNVPQSRLPDLVSLAGEVKDARITSLQFVPPLVDPADPDVDAIRDRVAQAVAASESAPEGAGDGGDGSGGGDAGGDPDGGDTDRGDQDRGDADDEEPDEGAPTSVDAACAYE